MVERFPEYEKSLFKPSTTITSFFKNPVIQPTIKNFTKKNAFTKNLQPKKKTPSWKFNPDYVLYCRQSKFDASLNKTTHVNNSQQRKWISSKAITQFDKPSNLNKSYHTIKNRNKEMRAIEIYIEIYFYIYIEQQQPLFFNFHTTNKKQRENIWMIHHRIANIQERPMR